MTTSIDLKQYKKHKFSPLFRIIIDAMIKRTGNQLDVVQKDSRFYHVTCQHYPWLIIKIPVTLIEEKMFKIGAILR
jgi:hypothetical protein